MTGAGGGKLQVCCSGHANVFCFEACPSSHVRPYLPDSSRSLILEKAHFAKFWKVVISLRCVGYSGILWLRAVRICACVFVSPSHILPGPFCNQQIVVWFNRCALALLESHRVRNGWDLKGPLGFI